MDDRRSDDVARRDQTPALSAQVLSVGGWPAVVNEINLPPLPESYFEERVDLAICEIRNPRKILIGNYLETYPDLLASAKHLAGTGEASAYVGVAHMAYAWMPRILHSMSGRTKSDSWKPAREYVAETGAKAMAAASLDDAVSLIESMSERAAINGSWVGTSKYLHFLHPSRFPIWDSRVAKHWTRAGYWWNSRLAYRDYLMNCHAVSDGPASRRFCEELKLDVTSIRAVELILFATSPEDETARA